jgi:hypothetical protein
MYEQPDAPRLPIFPTIQQSYEFLWSNRDDFFRMSAAPVVILALVEVLATALYPVKPGTGVTPQLLAILIVPSAILYVMFSVAWHRRFLKSSEHVTFWVALRWDKRKTLFLIRLVGIFLCVALISASPTIILTIVGGLLSIMSGAAGGSAAAPAGIGMIGMAIVLTIALLLYARLSLWLPATAIDEQYSLIAIWQLGRGNSWNLLGITLGAALPLMLIAILFAGALSGILLGSGLEGNLTGRFIAGLVGVFCNYVVLAAEITALSIAYRTVSRPADPGMPVYRTD